MIKNNRIKGLIALSPAFVLLVAYLVPSIISGDFYAMPISVAFVIASIYGFILLRGHTHDERISIFSQGASDSTLIYMIWIFILAGVFASSASAIGAVDAIVALTLKAVPSRFLPAGIFIASCFISMAIGTSVGTIVAMTPVVVGIAAHTGASVPWIVSIVVGGSFFGDNLSFISDTTIASTQSQGCAMKDKFKTNFMIVLPAAVACLIIYSTAGGNMAEVTSTETVRWWLSIPYLLVIVLAICGIKVLNVLVVGIVVSFGMGLCSGTTFFQLLKASGEGISGMGDIIIVTLLAGGLMSIIRTLGGLDFLISVLTSRVKGRRGAETVIALITALANLCTANNTIAIITTGKLARNIAERYGVSARRSASVLDISACIVQGLIPYGAQLLMASALASVAAVEIVPHLYYPMAAAVMLAVSIAFGIRDKKPSMSRRQ